MIPILAFDLGTVFAASLITPASTDEVLVEAFNCNSRSYGRQFSTFNKTVEKLLALAKSKNSRTLVVFEDVKRHSSTAAAHMYGYYRGTLQRLCMENGLQCVGINVKTAKKLVTKNGNASKDLTKQVVENILVSNKQSIAYFDTNRTDINLTYDEADSLSIAFAAKMLIDTDSYIKDSCDSTNIFYLEEQNAKTYPKRRIARTA